MFYAGIDWADDHHDVVVIDEAAKTRGSLRVDHSVSGITCDALKLFVNKPGTLPIEK